MLGPTPLHEELLEPTNLKRRKLVAALLDRFSFTFCNIDFRLNWEADNLNACATLIQGRRTVEIWGGLARHRALGENGLALALAHEVGHHLGGKPYDLDYSWLSAEGQADYWATRVGMHLVFAQEAVVGRSLEGARELLALYRRFYKPWRPRVASVGPPRVLSPRSRWLTFKAGALGDRRPACACRHA
jgi:hypothetical protein